MEWRVGTANPRRSILDKVMDGKIELLQQKVTNLKQENEQMQTEIQEPKKAMSKQEKNIIRNL